MGDRRGPQARPEHSASYGVRIVPPVLDAMDLSHGLIEAPSDVAQVVPAIDEAYSASRPHCFLIGRSPEAP